jgi:hypothetical protein
MKGQVVDLSPTDASASWDRIWLVVLPRFNFLSVSRSTRRGAQFAVASSALGWCQRTGCGSIAAITLHEKAVQPLHRRIAIEKFERVTPTSRTPFGGGNTERIRSRATACSPCLVWIADSIGRLPSRQLKVGPFDLHRDGPTARVRFLAPGPDIVGHRNHSRLDLNGIGQVLWKSRQPLAVSSGRGENPGTTLDPPD